MEICLRSALIKEAYKRLTIRRYDLYVQICHRFAHFHSPFAMNGTALSKNDMTNDFMIGLVATAGAGIG